MDYGLDFLVLQISENLIQNDNKEIISENTGEAAGMVNSTGSAGTWGLIQLSALTPLNRGGANSPQEQMAGRVPRFPPSYLTFRSRGSPPHPNVPSWVKKLVPEAPAPGILASNWGDMPLNWVSCLFFNKLMA